MAQLAVRSLLLSLLLVSLVVAASAGIAKLNSSSPLFGIEFPPFNTAVACALCLDCFEQRGPVFDPAASSSYRNVTCGDQRCGLVAPPPEASSPRACRRPGEDPCPYYYWYGDQSNTTGDLALESFMVNLTALGASRRVDGVVFGCGHPNRGLLHGAAGLLGLGRGSLSFASQLCAVYGHTFSYCLVNHGSDVGSKVVFGEDALVLAAHPQLKYSAFAAASSPADTFYYVKLKGVLVGGELLNISSDTWDAGKDGSGGTIIDSGTTLSYFAEPAYQVADFPLLNPCYNVSGVERPEVPELSLLFADGAVWDFPAENYFIRLDPDGIMCLAVLGNPRTGMSIIGNFQQQNFHVVYDLQNNRLGFTPRRCAEV
ncbi:unnamed protein product [Miscanthus lutarioriparius]|uniref:Peptidase A1 domain-containing protein n=1 Tax=Miscanthus lutarioriparius TaxID=422564 RepID=A0A811N866_9POAL|nr:unnamed protein product [Miscanthus lutarioriparius]